jgi:hypothetical protein
MKPQFDTTAGRARRRRRAIAKAKLSMAVRWDIDPEHFFGTGKGVRL